MDKELNLVRCGTRNLFGNELNLVRCGTRKLFGLVGEILPQGGQATFISIACNEAHTIGCKTMLDVGPNVGYPMLDFS